MNINTSHPPPVAGLSQAEATSGATHVPSQPSTEFPQIPENLGAPAGPNTIEENAKAVRQKAKNSSKGWKALKLVAASVLLLPLATVGVVLGGLVWGAGKVAANEAFKQEGSKLMEFGAELFAGPINDFIKKQIQESQADSGASQQFPIDHSKNPSPPHTPRPHVLPNDLGQASPRAVSSANQTGLGNTVASGSSAFSAFLSMIFGSG
ncbi:MAG: hypothetical protein WB791_04705 [Waddliaceae bacterium]